jgi:hypothetical protein
MLDRQQCLGNGFGIARPSVGLEEFCANRAKGRLKSHWENGTSPGSTVLETARNALATQQPGFIDTQTKHPEQTERKVRAAALTDYLVLGTFMSSVGQGKRLCRLLRLVLRPPPRVVPIFKSVLIGRFISQSTLRPAEVSACCIRNCSRPSTVWNITAATFEGQIRGFVPPILKRTNWTEWYYEGFKT